ncbi:MAG: winged helix DNA-binding protein [Methanomassiliicoccaceae archaeon]|jgi:DNA-binding MarR family transcriptional regulator|nr:winged helix DNA-binding protein [Methanomassiliicoccaceae archaeon]
MNYNELAKELLHNMQSVRKAKHQRYVEEGVRGEAFVLNCIKECKEGIVPGNISDNAGLSSARVAAVLNALENKEMITREIDNGDRRRIIVKLTQKGTERAEEQERKYVEAMENILRLLGEDDAREYVRLTGRMAEVLCENNHESDITFNMKGKMR